MPVTLETTLADLVIEDPRRTRVLDEYMLDYCCNGHRRLGDAARAAGVDPDDLSTALDLPGEAPAARLTAPGAAGALAHEIVDTHHAWMWQEMPRLLALVEKVHRVHHDKHPELAEVLVTCREAFAALEPHMTTEERVVFPAISQMERGTRPSARLSNRIEELREEHREVGALFGRLRELTDDWTAPPDACGSFRAMMTGLESMDADLREHIHKENNVLFPHAVDLEQGLAD